MTTGISSADKHCIINLNLLLNKSLIPIFNSFGKNDKKLPRIKSYFRIFLEQFEDTTIRILLVAATLTLLAGMYSNKGNEWLEGVSIYFAVLLIALFASASNYMKEK